MTDPILNEVKELRDVVERFRRMAFLPRGTAPRDIAEHYNSVLRSYNYPENKERALSPVETIHRLTRERDEMQRKSAELARFITRWCDLTREEAEVALAEIPESELAKLLTQSGRKDIIIALAMVGAKQALKEYEEYNRLLSSRAKKDE